MTGLNVQVNRHTGLPSTHLFVLQVSARLHWNVAAAATRRTAEAPTGVGDGWVRARRLHEATTPKATRGWLLPRVVRPSAPQLTTGQTTTMATRAYPIMASWEAWQCCVRITGYPFSSKANKQGKTKNVSSRTVHRIRPAWHAFSRQLRLALFPLLDHFSRALHRPAEWE